LKNFVGYYNAGVVAVNSKVVGLAPEFRLERFLKEEKLAQC
jgi:hypothetical protein